MRCMECGAEVGKAQIICDNCGSILMEQRTQRSLEHSAGPPESSAVPPVEPAAMGPQPEAPAEPVEDMPEEPPPEEPAGQERFPIEEPDNPAPADEQEGLDEPPPPPPPLGEAQAKFIKSPVFIILLTLLLFTAPVALFLIWKSDWEPRKKITFAAMNVLYMLVGAIAIIGLLMAVLNPAPQVY